MEISRLIIAVNVRSRPLRSLLNRLLLDQRKMKYLFSFVLVAALLVPFDSNAIDWKSVEEGFDFAKYELGDASSVIRSEVYLLRFDPQRFNFIAVTADSEGDEDRPPAADLRTLTKKSAGVAGINANFFDEKGSPLGLLMDNGTMVHKIHRGGKVLSGIFAVRNDGSAFISHRSDFDTRGIATAIQAGPRLVTGGKAVPISSADESSRRSGIAITKKNAVILYATVLRFPGATLGDIQGMLLDPTLEVAEALNLDGGGSSQLFIESFASLSGETFISGGDRVPVGLIVRRRKTP